MSNSGFKRFRPSVEEAESIKLAYQAGEGSTSLAKKYGVTHVTITAFLRKIGIAIRPRKTFFPTEAELESLKEAFLQGASASELGTRYGVSHQVIGNVLRKMGIKRGYQQKFRPVPEVQKEIVEAYEAGESIADLAKVHGILRTSMSDFLSRIGIEPRPPSKRGELRRRNTADGDLICCNHCHIQKPKEEFAKNGGSWTGRLFTCRKCHSLETRLRKYNLTLSDLERMIKDQNGKCRICLKNFDDGHAPGAAPTGKARRRSGKYAVDHCHISGVVRGLLCGPCNRAIGLLRDDPESCERAAQYLRRSQVKRAG